MKKPKNENKKMKTALLWLGVTFAVMLSLFIVLLILLNGTKDFIVRLVGTMPEEPLADIVSTTSPPQTTDPVITETEPKSTSSPTTEIPTNIATKTETTAPINSLKHIDTTKRYNHSLLLEDINKAAALYPKLISVSTAGNSVNGRAIKLMKVGKGDKKAFILGSIHAREIITSKYLMLCIFEYCEAYNSKSGKYGSYNVKKLLDEYTLYIVPCANPDGMEIVSNRKVPNAYIADFSRYDYKANTNGADLNRNFPLAWEQVKNGVTKPSNAAYKGAAAGSEPETKCVMSICKNNQFEFALSFHITGECIFWGDTYDTSLNENYRKFAKRLTDLTDFYLTPISNDVNSYGGGFENWFRHEYKKPGLCVELVSYKYTSSPTDNTDYKDFSGTVNWGVSKYIILEAIS